MDHPSFGHAIISRVLEDAGYNVGILSQPDWKNPDSIRALGSHGWASRHGRQYDSMVNHYSVSKRRRETDAFTPGGVMGKRPDYAAVVYCNLIRRVYPHATILLGGIEASLRRLAHYDYWSGQAQALHPPRFPGGSPDVRHGRAGGGGDCRRPQQWHEAKDITWIDGTVFSCKEPDGAVEQIVLPSYEEIVADGRKYAESFRIQSQNTDPFTAKRLVEPYGKNLFVVQNPPQKPLTQAEMDHVYDLPYARTYHPSYEALGGVPAIAEVKFSLVSCRGCFGACSFCALTFHQGRIIQARSHESILAEAEKIIADPDFKGYIHDVGGPTANFRHPACDKQLTKGVCQNRQCLFPTPCRTSRQTTATI